ncbi:low molecular weight protein-tyrosine-phosphatase [Planktosalinus lacus]|uniref:protein-tyrosine-phosphatase n=1 Tax=Planktosalinus lacus TaxID=1526573 RepID=A0A8J2VB09_9FLAO|nr:low molecular weight protein-tyrosine-phosphatase [Planktosalinus lacus]GGD97264.1 protein-tyrosine-phosphatase [Planktosalinus lacus]
MKTKILMVCLGNICRSPLAEGILKSKLNPDRFEVHSAGTGHWHIGELPDKRSIKVAKKYGIDITDQRGKQFAEKDFNEFDIIYVMDIENKKNLLKMAPNDESKQKVKLILNELFENENVDVPDPYYGSDHDFEHVYKLLDEASSIISKKLSV